MMWAETTRVPVVAARSIKNAMEEIPKFMQQRMQNTIRLGAGAIIIKDGKTLLAKRKGKHALAIGHWGSSGGHVEPGESPAQAAIREAREELGIEIGNLKFLICLDEQWKNGKQYVDIIFLADILSGKPIPMEPDKVEVVEWFPLNKLPEPIFPPVEIALRNLQTGKLYDEYKE